MNDEFVTADRIERAIERSAIVESTTRARSEIERGIGRLEEAIGQSHVQRYVDRAGSGIDDALAAATVVTVASTLARFTRASFLYRWLTAEPEPQVIVIDLRDTVTVGPVVAALDASFEYLDSWLPSSALAGRAGETVDDIQAAPIRVASIVTLAAATAAFLANLATGAASSGAFLGYAIVLGIAALGYRDTRSWNEVRETRPVRLFVALLEPPEPPGDGSWDERTSTERDDSEE